MKIALVGNQNSGKTTLFNLLTGSNQKVGNWPGVTMDRKTGIIKGTNHKLIDLPGVYSLSPYTIEEEVSRDYIFNERPDLIVNIIDATSIERSLYLTTQLLELDTKIIIALNMTDILEAKGVNIDLEKLSKILGVKEIARVSALKATGIDELISLIDNPFTINREERKIFKAPIENSIIKIENRLSTIHKRFVAIKLLEKDLLFKHYDNHLVQEEAKYLELHYRTDVEEIIASGRYDYIETVKDFAVTVKTRKVSATDKLDKILINKYLGIPIFAIIMFLVYFLSVGVVGSATVDLIDGAFSSLAEASKNFLTSIGASDWAVSLISDGALAGVGAILNFVPQLLILFLCIALLESTGYMSRISFLLDRIFRKFGLSGKSLVPFIVGSGCSVPAIMTTRSIEDSEEREMMITLTPFFPCSAKLPIISLFAGFFFENSYGLVTFSLYVLAVVVILASAVIMKKFVYTKSTSSFITELPDYKIPNPKYLLREVFEKTFGFIKRAGTIIFLCSIVIWFLLSFNWSFEYGIEVENSILASIGNLLSWVFYPILGELSWGATVSALQGLVAKEQVISSMAIIAGFAGDVSEGSIIFGQGGIFGFFTPASAYAFMAFNLFSAPCFGAIGAMRKEFGSMKKTIKAVGFQTAIAWLLATLIHVIGLLIGVLF